MGGQAGKIPHKRDILGRHSLYSSGKSTLLSALLRLLEISTGIIEVDGIDIKHVRLDTLRRRCFVTVTQDPLLMLNETLRFNLDPDSSVSDEIIIGAISKVGLSPYFLTSEAHQGERSTHDASRPILNQQMSIFRALSMGQRQLFALCRALVKATSLRNSNIKPIILLDEVSSSLDATTESIVQGLIEDEFTGRGHTVVIVTHRLGALIEYCKPRRDTVVLMADGKVEKVIRDRFGSEAI